MQTLPQIVMSVIDLDVYEGASSDSIDAKLL